MGTLVRITVYVPKGRNPARALRATFERIGKLGREFSDYREDSELSRVSREAWQAPVRVSPELFFVLRSALEISELSEGAFDVTSGPVGGAGNVFVIDPCKPRWL